MKTAKVWLKTKLKKIDHDTLNASLGRYGSLEVRLARTASEIRKCQMLRYKVFYKEMAAKPNILSKILQRDSDRLDPFCDHMMVVDYDTKKQKALGSARPRVVGTYRLLRQELAEKNSGFYSQDEFDIEPLLKRHANLSFLELGRSCVLKPYRNKKTVELLWQGVWSYILLHKHDVVFGCASLDGASPKKHALALSYLAHFHGADAEWQAPALSDMRVDMDLIPKKDIDAKNALAALPPLVKGYLRLGAMIGKGAVIDTQFNTIDVLMILPVSRISERYIDYFGKDADRFEK